MHWNIERGRGMRTWLVVTHPCNVLCVYLILKHDVKGRGEADWNRHSVDGCGGCLSVE